MMKKVTVVLAALVFLACALSASADITLNLLTAEVVLVDMERSGNGHLLLLRLPDGDELVVFAVGHCQYFDNRNSAVSPGVFLQRFGGRRISIDFFESESNLPEYENIVLQCRGF